MVDTGDSEKETRGGGKEERRIYSAFGGGEAEKIELLSIDSSPVERFSLKRKRPG